MNIKEMAKKLGSKGGKKSAEIRMSGMTKEQKSELMRKVRLSKEEKKIFEKGLQGMIDNLNK